jgi:hypothetical protein
MIFRRHGHKLLPAAKLDLIKIACNNAGRNDIIIVIGQ